MRLFRWALWELFNAGSDTGGNVGVSDLDLRSTRLQWIRDGSNWLVGIGTGALVLSGTYFYDRFDRSPNAASLLIAAWILLTLSALFGVLTSFSA